MMFWNGNVDCGIIDYLLSQLIFVDIPISLIGVITFTALSPVMASKPGLSVKVYEKGCQLIAYRYAPITQLRTTWLTN